MNILTSTLAFFRSFTRPYPDRDWTLVLSVALLGFLAATIFATYLFWGIRSGTIIGNAAGTPIVSQNVSRADMQSVIDAYRIRKANYEARNFSVPVLR